MIDTSGTYTVTISSADVAQSLVINDAEATVLDENRRIPHTRWRPHN